MSKEKNLYEILELSPNSSESAIKSAYRKLARKYHPDLNGGKTECTNKFKEISEAYEILSNKDKKKNYDILNGFYKNTSQAQQKEANKAYREAGKEDKKSQTKNPASPKNETEGFADIFNDILKGFKNTTSNKEIRFKSEVKPEKGTDIYTDVKIDMHEAKSGTSRTVNILHTQICPNCEGRTFLNGTKCPLCNGTGEQSVHKKLNVKIPANVKHGSKIRIAGEGNSGYNGGVNGDLYLNIKIEGDAGFKYDGQNVLCDVSIKPFEAVLGANIEIETIRGNVMMKIFPNTHSRQKYRLAGEGLAPYNGEGTKGDMIVTVIIDTPKNPSKEEIKLYERLRELNKSDKRENK